MVNDIFLIISSTTTDAMYNRRSGNCKRDESLIVVEFKESVEALLMSPSDFYVIGVGFIHIRNGSGHQSTLDLIEEMWDMKDIIDELDSLSNEKLAEVRELRKKVELLESGEVLLHVC